MLNGDYHTFVKRNLLEAWKCRKKIKAIKKHNVGKSK